MAQYNEANQHYRQANVAGLKDEGINLFNLGLVFSKLGRLSQSNEKFQQAIEKFGQKNDLQNKYMCHYNKGINHRRLDELSESIKELEEAKTLLSQMNEEPRASLYNNLGLTHFE